MDKQKPPRPWEKPTGYRDYFVIDGKPYEPKAQKPRRPARKKRK